MAAVYDFDGDGRLDVLGTEGIGSKSNANFVWAHNNGQGSFSILQNIQSGNGDFLQGVAVERLQNGGPLEVVLSWHAGTGGVQKLTVPTDPVNQTWNWSQLSSTTQKEQLTAGDIDRDGDADLLLGTLWLRNDGASWSTHTISNTSSIPDRSRLADVNGDGRLDAVIGFEFESKLSWYEQGASPTALWTEHSIATDFYAPMPVFTFMRTTVLVARGPPTPSTPETSTTMAHSSLTSTTMAISILSPSGGATAVFFFTRINRIQEGHPAIALRSHDSPQTRVPVKLHWQ
jgi:hypothetical protein